MEKKILSAVKKYQMQDIYSGAVLAFSGGADSSALLEYLSSRTKNLVCVHINHMIRGDEADRDEEFAKESAKKYGVKFISKRIDIPKLAAERKTGLEETARKERYKVFDEILSSNPEYKCIVTAHNADDNAETVLFNLTRGTGASGLVGIKPVNGKIMRPLIYLSKKDIIDYCLANNIEYVTDSTNLDTVYTRNHIRHNVIPELKKINPDFLDSVLRLGSLVSADEEYFDREIDRIICENKIENEMELSLLRSLDFSILSRLLRKLSPTELDYKATSACIDLINNAQAGAYINLCEGVSFKIEHSYAKFLKTDSLNSCEFCVQLNDGLTYIDEIDTVISVNCDTEPSGYKLTTQIRLDGSKIDKPLCARSRKNGDKIKAGKMTKKVKQIFVDNHIPSHLRDKIPLICLDGDIICVPDIALADGYKGNDFIINIFKEREG